MFDLNSPTGAVFSDCRDYRYLLWRSWSSNPYVLFICLNPSTADETQDDPTIRRCRRFAMDWGYGAIVMANLFAYRATKPKDMIDQQHPTGRDNDAWLHYLAQNAGIIVCAWGANGSYRNRGEKITQLLNPYKLMCLGVTKEGQPRHPLYIKADKQLEYLIV